MIVIYVYIKQPAAYVTIVEWENDGRARPCPAGVWQIAAPASDIYFGPRLNLAHII